MLLTIGGQETNFGGPAVWMTDRKMVNGALAMVPIDRLSGIGAIAGYFSGAPCAPDCGVENWKIGKMAIQSDSLISCSCVPVALTCPLSIRKIRSARITVQAGGRRDNRRAVLHQPLQCRLHRRF